MLLPLSSHWSRELAEAEGDSQFNTSISDVALSYYGSATVRPMLAPTRPKPTGEDDSFSPPQVLSDSTFSLLSRKYSPSTTDSSCDCSETSSVDENFQCGSGSPTMGSANWEVSSEHSDEDLSAGTLNGDDKTFSLLGVTPNVSIIPLAGMSVTEQPAPIEQSHGDEEVKNLTDAEYIESGAVLIVDELQTDCKGEEADTVATISAQITTDASLRSATDCDDETTINSDSAEASSSLHSSPATSVKRPSSLSLFTHTCPSCHLYAPSSSETFYLDAWLNQQNDIHPSSVSEEKVKSKKKVTWPDTTAELRNVIVVENWIEKGVHVHPQPRQRFNESDDSEDDDYECQRAKACEKEEGRVAIRVREEKAAVTKPISEVLPAVQQTPSSSTGSSKDSDCGSVGSSTSVRCNAIAPAPIRPVPSNKAAVSVPRVTETPIVKRPSPPSSVSSTSSASSSSTSTSSRPIQQQPARISKQPKVADPSLLSNSTPRVVTQLPTPKKKYSSGVTVKIIGGPYSEHEAAMKIRGVDPIKHRAMIENYWQY